MQPSIIQLHDVRNVRTYLDYHGFTDVPLILMLVQLLSKLGNLIYITPHPRITFVTDLIANNTVQH